VELTDVFPKLVQQRLPALIVCWCVVHAKIENNSEKRLVAFLCFSPVLLSVSVLHGCTTEWRNNGVMNTLGEEELVDNLHAVPRP
jgi:hypothetical protein